MSKEVKVQVAMQGDAVCGKGGYMLKQSEDVAAFYMDGWGKTGRIYPVSSSTSIVQEGKIAHYPSIMIEDGEETSTYTEIYFPEYEGWTVHSTNGGKTMSVCLVKP